MTIAHWCIAVACFLPYVFTVSAKIAARGFNNAKPRDFLDSLEGWRKRAHWAQLNSFEATPIFVAAVLVAQQVGAAQQTIDQLAIAFVGLRVLYGILYICDKATLRSLVWFASLGCCIALFVTAA